MARRLIAEGQLPWIPRTAWINVACGKGATCRLCGTPVEDHQLEYSMVDWSCGGGFTSLHAICHAAWRECAEGMLTGSDGWGR
jgi:hypothetical protein